MLIVAVWPTPWRLCCELKKIWTGWKIFARWRLHCECAKNHCKCAANALRLWKLKNIQFAVDSQSNSPKCESGITLWRIWRRLHCELKVFQFSKSPRSLSAFAAHSQCICSGVAYKQKFFNRFKIFLIRSAVSVESYCSLRGFAVHSPSNWRRLPCEVRLWRMHGDCAANHIRYNGNDVVDCFVINFILRNNEWWKGNGKINNSLNVSFWQK